MNYQLIRELVLDWAHKADRAAKVERELAALRLLVASEVARLRVLADEPEVIWGHRTLLQLVIENLSVPAPAQEEETAE